MSFAFGGIVPAGAPAIPLPAFCMGCGKHLGTGTPGESYLCNTCLSPEAGISESLTPWASATADPVWDVQRDVQRAVKALYEGSRV